MFRKLNTARLLVLFGILLAAVVIFQLYDSKKGESSFRTEITGFDSSAVSEFLIYPKAEEHKEIRLLRIGDQWEVSSGKIKGSADTSMIRHLIKSLTGLRPQRLAATEKESWKDFNVDDSAGTRIKILGNGKILSDLVLGKFSYSQETRSGISYVRLKDEKETYAVEGFLQMLVNRGFDGWRNKYLFAGRSDSWTDINFQFPGDSSFVLHKQNGKWMMNAGEVDTAKTSSVLSGLAGTMASGFVADFNPAGQTPLYKLTVSGGQGFNPVKIQAYSTLSEDKFVLTSSANPGSFFSGSKGGLFERIFLSKNKFLPDLVNADSSQK